MVVLGQVPYTRHVSDVALCMYLRSCLLDTLMFQFPTFNEDSKINKYKINKRLKWRSSKSSQATKAQT